MSEYENTFERDIIEKNNQDGEDRRSKFDQETVNDKRIRKCTMINILFLLIIYVFYKIIILGAFGYYNFRNVDRGDCYASSNSDLPSSKREDDSYIDVTWQYMLIIQIAFLLALF